MVIYLSGRYTGADDAETKENIKVAREWAVKLWDLNLNVICPMTNTGMFHKLCTVAKYDDFLSADLEIINMCDAVLFLPGWQESNGANVERQYCIENGIFCTENLDDILEQRKHYDNERFKEMRKMHMQMYRTSISKNRDYSALNIFATSEMGVLVRILDKIFRLCNLFGLDISTGKWTLPKEPKHESIDDSLLDLANYACIFSILRRGKWAKWTENGIQ